MEAQWASFLVQLKRTVNEQLVLPDHDDNNGPVSWFASAVMAAKSMDKRLLVVHFAVDVTRPPDAFPHIEVPSKRVIMVSMGRDLWPIFLTGAWKLCFDVQRAIQVQNVYVRGHDGYNEDKYHVEWHVYERNE